MMEIERRDRESQAGSVRGGAAGGVPGKRTLTEQLPDAASRGTIQCKQDPSSSQNSGAYTGAQSGTQNGGAQNGGQVIRQQSGGLDPRGQVINNLLQSYQNIDVEVPVPDVHAAQGQEWTGPGHKTHTHVQVPYWNNKYVKEIGGERLTPPAGFDSSARNTALRTLGIGANDALAAGKGRPEEIAGAVARALEAGLISKPGYAPVSDDAYWASAWRPVIEAWLIKVGLGLDCSGFVYQALHEVQRETGAQTTGDASDEDGILDYYPNVDTGRTLASDEAMGGVTNETLGMEVQAPEGLEVADVMYIHNHIRILMQVDRSRAAEGITQFTTAESTYDGRYSSGGQTRGPRVHEWRYRQGALEQRYEGAQDWVASSETPVYRRHLAPAAPLPAGGAGKRAVNNVLRKAAGTGSPGSAGAPGTADPGAALGGAGSGAPLPASTRQQMERSFGADFSGVRMHQGGAAEALGAQAFADGENVHFAPGRFQPGSRTGDALIGHELAHVVQQREGRVAAPQGKGAAVVEDAGLEAEADRMGDAAADGRAARMGGAASHGPTSHGHATDGPASHGHAAQGQAVQRKDDLGGESGGAPALAQGQGFDGLLATIDTVLTQRTAGQSPPVDQLHAPVQSLVEWCRTHLPDQAQVQQYLASNAPRDEKVRVIGDMGNELTRMEFMLGGLYNGSPSGTNWRTDAGSQSLFVATYLDAAGDLKPGYDWCTSFAGYGYGRLGAGDSVTNYFGSGPKQREHGAVVFPQTSWLLLHQLIAYWQADASRQTVITSASDLINQYMHDAAGVLNQLDPATGAERTPFLQYLYNQGASAGVVSALTSRSPQTTVPRIGDLLIFNPHGAASGTNDEHTAQIDRFLFPTLSTIEGNLGDTTGTRQLDLSNLDQLAQVYFISRPAEQIVPQDPAGGPAGAGGATGNRGAGLTELLSLRSHNQRIHDVFSKLSSTPSTAPYMGPAHNWGR
jgi:hypothetical protein